MGREEDEDVVDEAIGNLDDCGVDIATEPGLEILDLFLLVFKSCSDTLRRLLAEASISESLSAVLEGIAGLPG